MYSNAEIDSASALLPLIPNIDRVIGIKSQKIAQLYRTDAHNAKMLRNSVFITLSIGSGLLAAVLLRIIREAFKTYPLVL